MCLYKTVGKISQPLALWAEYESIALNTVYGDISQCQVLQSLESLGISNAEEFSVWKQDASCTLIALAHMKVLSKLHNKLQSELLLIERPVKQLTDFHIILEERPHLLVQLDLAAAIMSLTLALK